MTRASKKKLITVGNFLKIIGTVYTLGSFYGVMTFFEIVRSNGSASAYFSRREIIDGEPTATIFKIIFYSNGFLIPFLLLLLIFGLWSTNRDKDMFYIHKFTVYTGVAFLCILPLLVFILLLDPIVYLFRNHDGFLYLLVILGIPILFFGITLIVNELKKMRIRIPPDVDVICKCESCGAINKIEATQLILTGRKRH